MVPISRNGIRFSITSGRYENDPGCLDYEIPYLIPSHLNTLPFVCREAWNAFQNTFFNLNVWSSLMDTTSVPFAPNFDVLYFRSLRDTAPCSAFAEVYPGAAKKVSRVGFSLWVDPRKVLEILHEFGHVKEVFVVMRDPQPRVQRHSAWYDELSGGKGSELFSDFNKNMAKISLALDEWIIEKNWDKSMKVRVVPSWKNILDYEPSKDSLRPMIAPTPIGLVAGRPNSFVPSGGSYTITSQSEASGASRF